MTVNNELGRKGKGSHCVVILCAVLSLYGGRDSAVGIATGYGLDGPGIESRWGGEIFRIGVERPSFPPRLLYCGYREFLGVKRQERGAEHPLLAPRLRIPLPPLCASIDGISWGDLYLYTLYEPLWRNWIATRLRAVRSGVRIALGVKTFVLFSKR